MLDRLRVKERFECWNRDELEPMLEMYSEDAVFDVSDVFTDVAPVRGHEDMLCYWRELRETWGGGLRSDPLWTRCSAVRCPPTPSIAPRSCAMLRM